MSIHKTALRLPKELHLQILNSAKDSGISMNAEIVTRLQNSFNAEKEIIQKIDAGDAHIKSLIKASFSELLKEFESKGEIIIKKLDD